MEDSHRSGDAGELAAAGAGHHGDGESKISLIHCSDVLEGKGAAVTVEGSGDLLDGDVSGVAARRVAGGQHFALACGFKIAVELLDECIAADESASGGVVSSEWSGLDVEGSCCVAGHDGVLSERSRGWVLRWRLQSLA